MQSILFTMFGISTKNPSSIILKNFFVTLVPNHHVMKMQSYIAFTSVQVLLQDVKLLLCLIKHHAKTVYEGQGRIVSRILNLSIRWYV